MSDDQPGDESRPDRAANTEIIERIEEEPDPAASFHHAPDGERTISPFPIRPGRPEPAGEQAAALLLHIAGQLDTGSLLPHEVFTALSEQTDVDQFSRWTALNMIEVVCLHTVREANWTGPMPNSYPRPGDWLYWLTSRTDARNVEDALRAAAEVSLRSVRRPW